MIRICRLDYAFFRSFAWQFGSPSEQGEAVRGIQRNSTMLYPESYTLPVRPFAPITFKTLADFHLTQMPKRKAQSRSEAIVGFAWYSLRDWVWLKSAADDREELDDTYMEWVKHAETSIATLRSAGVDVRRVPVEMTELERWCREHNVPNTGKSRARFVAEKAREGLFLLPE